MGLAWFGLGLGSALAAPLPPDAQGLLDSLPGKKVTLDFVLARAMSSSDSFKAVIAQGAGVEVPLLSAKIPLDTRLSLSLGRQINENEALSSFMPNRSSGTQLKLGASTYFRTGTMLSFDLATGYSDMTFPGLGGPGTAFTAAGYETKPSFTLVQNLWKDGFGSGTRRGLEAGEFGREASQAAFDESLEEWVLGIVDIYYNAWMLQSRIKTAQDSLKRRQRLASITESKARRGTAERPDVLQVKSAVLATEVMAERANQGLAQVWRSLVVSLKLPSAWVNLDASEIPLVVDEFGPKQLELCQLLQKEGYEFALDSATRKLDLQAKAAELTLDRAKSLAAPEAQLLLAVSPNGISNTLGSSFSEGFTTQHLAWTASVGLNFPIMNYAAEAEVRNAIVNRERVESIAASAKRDMRVRWINQCDDTRRLVDSTRKLQQAFDNQLLRVQLDEDRFKIGKVPLLSVIQAGDDATYAEGDLRQTELEMRLAHWKLTRLAGKVKDYAQQVADQYRNFQSPYLKD
ncbi:MAG: TolC family protein [Bacteriovoracia bacterium]